ncbi:unnamed protein product [Gemmata massiliana]|uniref:Uncharacterized protein n=1 Tax=Gemmata massiliana TaxID=1210884 RepID=A0A6P2CYP1_9BACT|nr:hypothetical protein [Gemmata massiliana]VTR93983.1 unnamed protein product [Gemmata massiliana]
MVPLLLLLTAPGHDPLGHQPGPAEYPIPLPSLTAPIPAASTWDRMFPSGHCAGPALQPFQKQPRVCPVAVCACDSEASLPSKSIAWVKEFHTAAHVPYPRYDLSGCPVEGDGLLIYEGMRFAVDQKTGNYDLTFTATVPAMPVLLRLQLTLTSPDGKQEYKLTLPMIRMEPPRDAKPGDPAPRTFHVAHRGYSSLLFDPKQGIPPSQWDRQTATLKATIDNTWVITRTGTARFGTPIAIDDPNR